METNKWIKEDPVIEVNTITNYIVKEAHNGLSSNINIYEIRYVNTILTIK